MDKDTTADATSSYYQTMEEVAKLAMRLQSIARDRMAENGEKSRVSLEKGVAVQDRQAQAFERIATALEALVAIKERVF